ncbi:MAG: hypothetical protein WCA32_05560 [Chromatiaceae bacterium]|jgi:hypothetical protein
MRRVATERRRNVQLERALKEADELLNGLVEREDLHVQEVFALHGTLAMLYTAKGDNKAAAVLRNNLEFLVEDEDDAHRFEHVKRLVDGLDPMKRFASLLRSAANTPPRPKRKGG